MRNRGDLSVFRQIGGVVEFAGPKHGPYLGRHLCFDGCTDEEGLWLESGLRKRRVDSSQGRAGSLPVLIRSCRINAAFQFGKCRLAALRPLQPRALDSARNSAVTLSRPC